MPLFIVPDGTMPYDAIVGRESLRWLTTEETSDGVMLISRGEKKEVLNVFLCEVKEQPEDYVIHP